MPHDAKNPLHFGGRAEHYLFTLPHESFDEIATSLFGIPTSFVTEAGCWNAPDITVEGKVTIRCRADTAGDESWPPLKTYIEVEKTVYEALAEALRSTGAQVETAGHQPFDLGNITIICIPFPMADRLVPRFEDDHPVERYKSVSDMAAITATDADGNPVNLGDLPPETKIEVVGVDHASDVERTVFPFSLEEVAKKLGHAEADRAMERLKSDTDRQWRARMTNAERNAEIRSVSEGYLRHALGANHILTDHDIDRHVEAMRDHWSILLAVEAKPTSMADVLARQEARQKDAKPGDSFIIAEVGSTPWAMAMLLAGHQIRNLLWAGNHLVNVVWYWDKEFKALMWRDFVAGGCGPVGRNDAAHWLAINLDMTETWVLGEPAGDPDEARPETFEDRLMAVAATTGPKPIEILAFKRSNGTLTIELWGRNGELAEEFNVIGDTVTKI